MHLTVTPLPDFIAHPRHGVALLTPRAKIGLRLHHHVRACRVSLKAHLGERHLLVAGRYLLPEDDGPSGAPAAMARAS